MTGQTINVDGGKAMHWNGSCRLTNSYLGEQRLVRQPGHDRVCSATSEWRCQHGTVMTSPTARLSSARPSMLSAPCAYDGVEMIDGRLADVAARADGSRRR